MVKETKKEDGSTVIEITQKDGTTSITTSTPSGKTETQVKIPEKVGEEANQKGQPVPLPIPPAAVQSGAGASHVIKIDVGGTEDTKVSIPVDQTKPGVVAVRVNPDGTKEVVRKSIVTENGVTLTVDGQATLELEDRSKQFEDTAGHWAKDAITFVTSREMFYGTSTEAFSPDAEVTRGMLVTVLYNLEGNPLYENTTQFADVTSDAWFADAVQWAAANGIVSGFGNHQFAPNQQITRQDLVMMLYRYAGSPAPGGTGLNFRDSDQIDAYADGAFSWAVEHGIVTGTDAGTLDPKGTATRAQTAVMLKCFMESILG